MVRESYFDSTGNRVIGEEGFVTRVRVMSKDKVIAESWFDADGQPMPRWEAYSRENPASMDFFDTAAMQAEPDLPAVEALLDAAADRYWR